MDRACGVNKTQPCQNSTNYQSIIFRDSIVSSIQQGQQKLKTLKRTYQWTQGNILC